MWAFQNENKGVNLAYGGVTTNPERKVPAPIRLVVQQEPLDPPHAFLMQLARWMGLDVWGNSLLGQRVSRDMSAAALVLLIVLVFEFCTWSLLFNVLVHSANWQISWLTILALLLGAIFATVVFVFERGLMTADFSDHGLRKWLGLGLRLVVIFLSALATAQPVELLVFGESITERLHEELVLKEAILQVEELQRDRQEAVARPESEIEQELKQKAEYQQYSEAQALQTRLREEVRRLETAVATTRQVVNDARAKVERLKGEARSASDPEARQQSLEQLPAAEAAVTRADGRIPIAQEALDIAKERAKQAGLEAATATTTVTDLRNTLRDIETEKTSDARQREAQRVEWMRQIRRAPPGQEVRDANSNRVLPSASADFSQRLRVLDDLRFARPPQWPRGRYELRKEANHVFNLDANVDEVVDSGDPLMVRLKNNAESFNLQYQVAFIVALMIPLMSAAFKLMMSEQLSSYYSVRDQARALNPEAVQALDAQRVSDRTQPPPEQRPQHGSEFEL